jgi:hypothetical protein
VKSGGEWQSRAALRGRARTAVSSIAMRVLLVLVACAACGPPPGTPSTLPQPPPHALDGVAPRLAPGEQTTWNVYYHTMPIGSADLVIGERGARSTFRTSRVARALASVRYELETALDRGRVRGAREQLTLDGEHEHAETAVDGPAYTAGGEPARVPGGTNLHTLHSALGAVRAWSALRDARPGYLWLWSGGKLYRLDLSRPTRDDVLGVRALRLDGTVRAPHLSPSITLSVWLAANRDRTPLRFAFQSGIHRVTAEVSESNASLEAR